MAKSFAGTSVLMKRHCPHLWLLKDGDHRLSLYKHRIARSICDFPAAQLPR
jgi:hypothetical protein